MKGKIEILIAEDSKTQAEELKYFLESNNYKVQHANNGEEALALLKQNVPDIIISDVVMPKIDGYELCKRIKSDENLKKIPIILFTSLSGPEEIFKSLECGADSFVTKPYSEDFLITKIKDIIYSIESREDQIPEPGFEIIFGDQKYLIDSTRLQIIDFHLSINENAVKKSRELDKTNKELALTQHKLNELNKNLEDEVKVRSERIERLNTVLCVIHNINQLIVQEKDRETLIKKACENFVEVREFHSAWIALLDDDGKIIDFAGEGGNIDVSKPDEKFLHDYIPSCFKEALKTDDIVLIENVESDCKDCPWLKLHKEGKWGAMSAGFKSGGKCYGVINISLPAHYVTDKEYQSLFMEVAGDIAFALYSMELEEKRKQAEEALKEAQRYTRGLIEANLDALVTISDEGIITDVNSATELITGISRKKSIGADFSNYFTDPDVARKGYQKAFRDGYVLDYPLEIKHRDGKVTPVLYNASVYKDRDGNVAGVFVSARDITERKLAEEALHKSEQKLSGIIDSITDHMSMIDEHHNIVWVNDVAKKVFGPEIIGKKCYAVYHGRDQVCDPCIVTKTFADGKIHEHETEVIGAEGNKIDFWCTANVSSLHKDGRPRTVIEISRDITERKQAEEEICKLNEELEQKVIKRTAQLEAANKDLEAFSYSVSHDLRAPLRAINGFSEILSDDYKDKLDEEAKDLINVIRKNALDMNQLITDLLDFSRLGRQQVKTDKIDMKILARGIFDELRQIYPTRNITFKLMEIPPATGDRNLIRFVFSNLISNAIKFTEHRKIAEIEIGFLKKNKQLLYYVKDNGVGFQMDYAEKIFGVFQRLHSSEEFEGTGVGLAIVQRIIHKHGGEVMAKGEVDKGATFYFSLPKE